MSTEIKPFSNVDDTVLTMFALIKKHKNEPLVDKFLKGKTLQEIFDFISKDIRYLADPMQLKALEGGSIELLRSPKQTLIAMAGDCDCKAVLSGSIFEKNNIPYRIAISSSREDKKFHHVYPEVFLKGEWRTFDPTYNYNYLWEEKPFTAKRVYYAKPDGKIFKRNLK